jgi:cell division protease FtsH
MTFGQFKADLAVMLAGQIAEQQIFNEVSTGASSDLQSATTLARRIVTRFGMSKLGPRTFGQHEEMIFLGREIHEQRDYSEKTAQAIDGEMSRLLDEAKAVAAKILSTHVGLLEKVAKELLVKETLEKEEFEKLVGQKRA